MAHVMKFQRGALGHMLGHYDRSKETWENVRKSLSYRNCNLAAAVQPLKQLDFIHKRLSEVKVQNRKDVNVMATWVVTAPKDLPEHEQKKFFDSCYKFCSQRYGEQNVVSAWVHYDEPNGQPHMHYAFIPITQGTKKSKGEKTSIEKVSAKEVLTRADLQAFHHELKAHVEKDLGHEVAILNGATKDGNKTIKELRASGTVEMKREVKRIEGIIQEASKQAEPCSAGLLSFENTHVKLPRYVFEQLLEKTKSVVLPMQERITFLEQNSAPAIAKKLKEAEKQVAEVQGELSKSVEERNQAIKAKDQAEQEKNELHKEAERKTSDLMKPLEQKISDLQSKARRDAWNIRDLTDKIQELQDNEVLLTNTVRAFNVMYSEIKRQIEAGEKLNFFPIGKKISETIAYGTEGRVLTVNYWLKKCDPALSVDFCKKVEKAVNEYKQRQKQQRRSRDDDFSR